MILYLVLSACLVANALCLCPDDWSFYEPDGTCLWEIPFVKPYKIAITKCIYLGGRLVQIKDDRKRDFIFDEMHSGGKVYIGVSDKNRDGHFTYDDGSELGTYNPWGIGQPNNIGGNNFCVELMDTTEKTWNAIDCNKQLQFICEIGYKPGKFAPTTTTTTEQPTTTTAEQPRTTTTEIQAPIPVCPYQWVPYKPEGTCLRYMTTYQTRSRAEQMCFHRGGYLVRVKDDRKRDFIYDVLHSVGMVYIGVRDKNRDGHFTYDDGSELGAYNPWGIRQPRNKEYCVQLMGYNDRSWSTTDCSRRTYFVCEAPGKFAPSSTTTTEQPTTTTEQPTTTTEQPTTTTEQPTTTTEQPTTTTEQPTTTTEQPTTTTEQPTTTTEQPTTTTEQPITTTQQPTTTTTEINAASPACPHGYTLYEPEMTCLRWVQDLVNIDKARTVCKGDGGDLVKIHGDAERDFIVDEMGVSGKPFIGVLGVSLTVTYTYVDGTPLTSYRPWSIGHPDSRDISQICVELSASGDRNWSSTNCDVVHTFVCEMDAHVKSTTKAPVTATTDHPTTSTARPTTTTRRPTTTTQHPTTTTSHRHTTSTHYPTTTNNHQTTTTHQPTTATHQPTTTAEISKPECPSMYQLYGPERKCLKWVQSGAGLAKARSTCQRDGGDLVQIYDDAKRDFIIDVMGVRGTPKIGVFDVNQDGTYPYVDGTPLTDYQPWSAKQPGTNNKVLCVTLNTSGDKAWRKFDCTRRNRFICELDARNKAATTTTTAQQPRTTTTQQPSTTTAQQSTTAAQQPRTTTAQQSTTTAQQPRTTTTQQPRTTTAQQPRTTTAQQPRTTTAQQPTTTTEQPTTTAQQPSTTTQHPTTTTTKPESSVCLNGWAHNIRDNVCLGVYDRDMIAFEDARSVCQWGGGDLVTAIYDDQSRQFLAGLLNQDKEYWVGLFDTVTYIDGKELGEFDAFRPEEGFEHGHEYCVSMKGSQWSLTRCDKDRNFVCQNDPL